MNPLRKIKYLLLAVIFSFHCYAMKKVQLVGNWNLASRSFNLPVQAWTEDNNKDLLLEFSSYLGTVEVTVTDQSGEVIYHQSVETDAPVVISLDREVQAGDVLSVTDGSNLVYGIIN